LCTACTIINVKSSTDEYPHNKQFVYSIPNLKYMKSTWSLVYSIRYNAIIPKVILKNVELIYFIFITHVIYSQGMSRITYVEKQYYDIYRKESLFSLALCYN
jgi:hypothetical protein